MSSSWTQWSLNPTILTIISTGGRLNVMQGVSVREKAFSDDATSRGTHVFVTECGGMALAQEQQALLETSPLTQAISWLKRLLDLAQVPDGMDVDNAAVPPASDRR